VHGLLSLQLSFSLSLSLASLQHSESRKIQSQKELIVEKLEIKGCLALSGVINKENSWPPE
jgi:hypothetical protein